MPVQPAVASPISSRSRAVASPPRAIPAPLDQFSTEAVRAAESPVRPAIAPLRAADFSRPLDRAAIRSADDDLPAPAFAAKWTAAVQTSPLMFVRAFPGAFHADLKGVDPSRIPGREAINCGDAHPENFGLLTFGHQTVFAFNDLDDSGYCPTAFDAARYFTALSLYLNDPGHTRRVIEQYVDAVKDPELATPLAPELLPDWKKVREKGVKKATAGTDQIKLGKEISEATAEEKSAVIAALKAHPGSAHRKVIDVVASERVTGGSGGLRRFHVLTEKADGKRSILELKEAGQPGVELGRHTQKLSMDERLPVLKERFWGTRSPTDYFYVELLGGRFLARSRFTKKSIDLADLKTAERDQLLLAQVSALAAVHREAWSDVSKGELRAWLTGTTQTLTERWSKAFAAP
jgi:hypothetical protein